MNIPRSLSWLMMVGYPSVILVLTVNIVIYLYRILIDMGHYLDAGTYFMMVFQLAGCAVAAILATFAIIMSIIYLMRGGYNARW